MALRLLARNNKMVKIHWSFYIIIGVGVLFASNRLNSQTGSRDFDLFLWVGYLFLIIGVTKLGIWFISRKKESPVERRAAGGGIYQGASQRQVVRQRAMYCPRCGNMLRGYENFCTGCGQRVR